MPLWRRHSKRVTHEDFLDCDVQEVRLTELIVPRFPKLRKFASDLAKSSEVTPDLNPDFHAHARTLSIEYLCWKQK